MSNQNNEGRKGTQWKESDFIRNRFYNFLGADAPATIGAKELADNCTDQICDGKTNKGYFEIGPDFRSVIAVDGGNGISTKRTIREDTGKESTYLFLAIAKLYNSTNYGDQSDDDSTTVGSNGVGSKCNNFLSSFFTAGRIARHPSKHKIQNVVPQAKDISGKDFNNGEFYNQETFDKFYKNANGAVYGYNFMQGNATIDGVNPQGEAEPAWIGVNVPLFEGETKPYGYYVHAIYDNSIVGFGDEINVKFIQDYIKVRLESTSADKEDIYFTFRYPVKKEDGTVEMNEVVYIRPVSVKEFTKSHKKEIESGRYIVLISWDDQVKDIINNPEYAGEVFGPYHSGYYDMIFAKRPEILKDIQNVCQGAVVQNPKSINVDFDVAGTKVKMPCPVAWKLTAKRAKGLQYSDQTKRKISCNKTTPKAIHLDNLEATIRKIPELMAHWESEANSKFLKKQGKTLQSDFYWPASGGETAREYFGEPFKKNPEYALEVIDRIRDDEDVINYSKINNIDIDNIKLNFKNTECLSKLVELQMIYNGINEENFDKEFKILLIVEGHSASSGIRTARNSKVVGVLALRGKILNVWQKTLANAMKSEIIKELIKVLQDDSYDKIISCTDADADGSSITTLLLGCIVKFRKDILKEGRFYNNLAPLYTFKDIKTRTLVGWGNDKHAAPKGSRIVVNKGLGSYDPAEIKRLILNPSAGAEWEMIVYDKEAVKHLTIALESGGKELVYKQNPDNSFVPFV